jgi:hypothetical protein
MILKSYAIAAEPTGRRSIQAGFFGSDKAKLGRARVARTILYAVIVGLDPPAGRSPSAGEGPANPS